MTISKEPQPLSYNGNGVVTAFSITWRYLAKSDVVVTHRSSAGVETVWVLNTDYTLTDADVEAGGTLTATTAPATGTTLTITLEPPNTQSTSLPLGGPFPSASVEDELDRAAQRDSKITNLYNRALRVPKSDTQTGDELELPIDTARASKFLAFNASGSPIAAAGTSANLGPVSAFVDTLLDDSSGDVFLTTLGMTSSRLRTALTLTETEVISSDPGDFSKGNFVSVIPQFPWSAPTKLTNPSSLPAGNATGCAWSSNGEFLVITHASTPFITIYQRVGTTFIKLTDPASLPASDAAGCAISPNGEMLAVAHANTPFVTVYHHGQAVFTKFSKLAQLPASDGAECAFSPNGEFLAVAHTTTPFITIYQRGMGTMLIKVADPSSLPAGNAAGCAWSPNGEFLAVAHTTTPFITIYQRTAATTFTKLSDPSSLPAGNALGCSWSPNGEFLVVAHNTTPFITIYQRSGTTFTKQSDPSSLPAGIGRGCAWSPNSEFLAVAHSTTPFVTIYQRSSTVFTKLSDPATLPASDGVGCAFSPNGEFLAVAHSTTPFVTIYQTASNLSAEAVLTMRKKLRAGV